MPGKQVVGKADKLTVVDTGIVAAEVEMMLVKKVVAGKMVVVGKMVVDKLVVEKMVVEMTAVGKDLTVQT